VQKSHLSVPSKLYNFMAVGRPILGLASSSSEVAGLISSTGCGRCVSPEEPERIAQALLQFKNSPAEAQGMAVLGRRYAENYFSKSKILAEYERLITRMAN